MYILFLLERLRAVQIRRQNGIARKTFIRFRVAVLPQLLGIYNL